MKNSLVFIFGAGLLILFSCQQQENAGSPIENTVVPRTTGQSGVQDNVSAPNIVGIASSSKDHSTLVSAVKAAELVDVLTNAGPFTVFAPTNDAFSKLPEGTLDELLKPEKRPDLQNILQYHVYVGVITTDQLNDGQSLNMVNGDNVTIHVKDGKYVVNDANIVASIRASNGIIHVVDGVLLPPQK